MARTTIRRAADLAPGHVLAPERYDPGRERLGTAGAGALPLRALVRVAHRLVPARPPAAPVRYLVLDTTHARAGLIAGAAPLVSRLRSARKELAPGQVIVSRLRPYLRQVALVDPEVPGWAPGVRLVCSPEFYVLEPLDPAPLAFLVPWLLSDPVQEVLAAAQEGGHHPRVREEALLDLPVPAAWVAEREARSRAVEEAVRLFREAERRLGGEVAAAAGLLGE